MVWGSKPIFLPFDADPLSAFTSLADIELNDPVTGPPELHSAPPRGTGGHPRLVATALALALRRTDGRPRLVSAILATQPLIIPPSRP
jgi:hypothetical protein